MFYCILFWFLTYYLNIKKYNILLIFNKKSSKRSVLNENEIFNYLYIIYNCFNIIVNAVDNDTYEVISSDNNTNDTLSVDKNISKLKNNNSEESVILTPIIKINPNILSGHAKDKVKVSVNVNAKFNDVEHKVKVGKLSLIKNGKTIKTIDLSKNNQPIKFMITLKKGDKYQLEYEGASDHSGEIEFTYKDAQEKIPIKIKDKKINKDSKKESKKKVKKN